jgi:poly(hydroxyalkanoate) granule-associated protein
MSEAQTTTPSGFGRARQELLNAGRNLWLASLGALVEADEASIRLFDRLVERGRPLDERQRKTVEAFTDRANGAMREAGKLFQDTVEYETKQVLKKIGVLTRDDLRTLSARLDILSKQIDEYAAAKAAAESVVVTPDTAALPEETASERRPRQRKSTR